MVQELDSTTVLEAQAKSAPQRSILDLCGLVEEYLDRNQRKVFYQIFELDYDEAPMDYPTDEARWRVMKDFRLDSPLTVRQSLDVTNKILGEETLTSLLRANRPLPTGPNGNSRKLTELEKQDSMRDCLGCYPDISAPQDSFGPIRGKKSLTVANAGGYTAWNSMVVPPDDHNLLDIDLETHDDMLHTARRWVEAANAHDSELRFGFIGWNRLFRAGASKLHPHIQVMVKRKPFEETELLRKAMAKYQYEHEYPYLDELAYCLRPLGLVFDVGSAHIVFNPVPKKEKEVMIYSNDGDGLPNGDLSLASFLVLEWWQQKLGVTSSNMAIYIPPIGTRVKEERNGWHNFFPLVRMVDRGEEGNPTSDIGVMELYAASVVSFDPIRHSQSFAQYLKEKMAV